MKTKLDLAEVEDRMKAWRTSPVHAGGYSCCSAHASAEDVPALVAEVKDLRMRLATVEQGLRDILTRPWRSVTTEEGDRT